MLKKMLLFIISLYEVSQKMPYKKTKYLFFFETKYLKTQILKPGYGGTCL